VISISGHRSLASLISTAGCTNSFQIYNTVINAPFKAGARLGVKARIYECYDKRFFQMNLNIMTISPICISNKKTIANTFKNQARVNEARSEERYLIASKKPPEEEESETDTMDELLGSRSSEEECEQLILKLPNRLMAAKIK